jgi:hypothetical protein
MFLHSHGKRDKERRIMTFPGAEKDILEFFCMGNEEG